MKKGILCLMTLLAVFALFGCKSSNGPSSKSAPNPPSVTPGFTLGDSVYVNRGARIYGWDSVQYEGLHVSCASGDSITLSVNYIGMKVIDSIGHATAYYDSIQLTSNDTSRCSIYVTDQVGSNRYNYLQLGMNRVVVSVHPFQDTTIKHQTIIIKPTISSESPLASEFVSLFSVGIDYIVGNTLWIGSRG
jgi:hypothetical protein